MSKYRTLYDIQRVLETYDQSAPGHSIHDLLGQIREIMARPEEPPPDTRYNGWTNYATWRVNLELLSDECDSLESNRQTFASAYELADYLKEYTETTVSGERYGDAVSQLAADYALSFVSDVNYDEIADQYPDLIESDEDDGGDA
jgi:hypothetical protein